MFGNLISAGTAFADVDNTIHVNYSANGGTNAGNLYNGSIVSGGDYTVLSVGTENNELNFIAPKSNLVFNGWNTQPDGTGKSYVAGQKYSPWPEDKDTILYAQWVTTATLSFNLNGSTGNTVPDSITHKTSSDFIVPEVPQNLKSSVANTHIGTNWNTAADGSGTSYAPGDSIKLTGNQTLYVEIVPNNPIDNALLTFNLADGETDDSDIISGIQAVDKIITLPKSVPSRDNYLFSYWQINGKNYNPGDVLSIDQPTTATAIWTSNFKTNINFYSDGTTTGMPENVTVKSDGSSWAMPTNIPTRKSDNGKNYFFNYWFDEKNNVKVYPGTDIRLSLTTETKNFKAEWTTTDINSQYTLTFVGNDQTSGNPNPANVSVNKGSTFTIPGQGNLTKDNFIFGGWKDTNDNKVYLPGDQVTPTKDTTFTAVWKNIKTDGIIKFDSRAQSGSNPAWILGISGEKVTIPNAPSDNVSPIDGQLFWGWAKNPMASVPDYYAGDSINLPSGITTLYGLWGTGYRYWTQIKIDLNSGTGKLPDGYNARNLYKLASADEKHQFIVPSASQITRKGYTFSGWKANDGKIYQPGDIISLSDLSGGGTPENLVAQWDIIKYDISYVPGEATGGKIPADSSKVNYHSNYTLLGNSGNLTKENSVFVGWKDTETQTMFAPGQKFLATKNVVFEPVFQVITNGNGGGVGKDQRTISYVGLESDIQGQVPASDVANVASWYQVKNADSTFTRPGYTFSGWMTIDPYGNQVVYDPGSMFVVSQNVVFYATWTPKVTKPDNSYLLSFNGNNNTGGNSPRPSYVQQGLSTQLPGPGTLTKNVANDINPTNGEIISSDAYIFAGWSTNKDATADEALPEGTSVTLGKDTVYYAIWDLKEKDVTLKYNGQQQTSGILPENKTDKRYTMLTVDPDNNGQDLQKKEINPNTGETNSFIFGGWNTNIDGSGTGYYSGSRMALQKDTTLYATWVPTKSNDSDQYRYIYIGNGNTGGKYLSYDDTTKSSYVIKNSGNLVKTGYIFSGWNTKSDGTGKNYNVGESIDTSKQPNLVLYAQWKKVVDNKLNIIYDGNGNTSGDIPSSYVGQTGDNVTLAGGSLSSGFTLEKTGYSFAGWSQSPQGLGIQYAPGTSYQFFVNTVLYAIWVPNQFYLAKAASVKYYANYNISDTTNPYVEQGYVDSKKEVDNLNVLPGHKIKNQEINGGAYIGEFSYIPDVSETGFSLAHATFKGWAKSPNATEPDYKAGDKILVTTDNTNLYAVWDKEKAADVTAKYVDVEGNTISDSEVKSGFIGDSYTTDQKNIKGYTFKEVQGNAKGIFTDKEQTVTYVYNRTKAADVTVKYVDEKSNKISDSIVKSGNVGDKYSTEQKAIHGYTFKEVKGNRTGTFTADAQTVTYVYTKDLVIPPNPQKPVTPDNSKPGSTANNNMTVNSTTTNNFVKTVKKAAENILPKTAAEKVGFSAILAIILASVIGSLIFKNRRNKH